MTRGLNRLQPWGVALVRLVLGVSMLVHGFEKLVPSGNLYHAHPLAGLNHFSAFVVTLGLPHWLGYVSVLTEFIGGLLLICGFLTRFAALMITGNLLVALVTVNLHKGHSGSEYTLGLISMAFLLVLTGAGACSLDRRLGIS